MFDLCIQLSFMFHSLVLFFIITWGGGGWLEWHMESHKILLTLGASKHLNLALSKITQKYRVNPRNK